MSPDVSLLDRIAPEGALLLLIAGASENDEAIKARMQQPVSWPLLLWLADQERATSILWRRLSRVAPEQIPTEVRGDLQRASMLSDFSAAYLEERTGDTLRALESRGIDVLLLKGAALAKTAFDGFIDRPMGDVDLLVPEARAREAWDVAREVGWRWEEELYPHSHYSGHHHLPPLLGRSGTDIKLEVHSALFIDGHPFRLTEAAMSERAVRVQVGKGHAHAPALENMLVHVALHHAWSHMMAFGGWRAIRDVVAICAKGVDWDLFVKQGGDQRSATACYWMLRIAKNLSGAAVPDSVLRQLLARVPIPATRVLERHFVRDLFPLAGACPSSRLTRWMWNRAMQPVASGHGAVRPWLLEDPPSHGRARPTLGGEIASMARQAGRIGDWWRYGRDLLA